MAEAMEADTEEEWEEARVKLVARAVARRAEALEEDPEAVPA
jgi:hypothetical protein